MYQAWHEVKCQYLHLHSSYSDSEVVILAIFVLGDPNFLAVVRENEIVRGPRWPSTLGMDPHEVAGGLCNNGGRP